MSGKPSFSIGTYTLDTFDMTSTKTSHTAALSATLSISLASILRTLYGTSNIYYRRMNFHKPTYFIQFFPYLSIILLLL